MRFRARAVPALRVKGGDPVAVGGSDESPSSILNRAANQIATVGACRLSLDEVRALAAELGGSPPSYGALAIRLGKRIGADTYYYGCTDSGPKAGAHRHEHLFGPDPKARIKVPGRRKVKVSEHLGDALPYLGFMGGKTRPAKLPPGWRWHEKPDSADGAPA